MIKHIVMFKLKDFGTSKEKEIALTRVKENFEQLASVVPDILSYRVAINISASPSAYDIVIDSEFKSLENLKNYSNHQAHINAVDFNKNYSVDKKVVDYEF